MADRRTTTAQRAQALFVAARQLDQLAEEVEVVEVEDTPIPGNLRVVALSLTNLGIELMTEATPATIHGGG